MLLFEAPAPAAFATLRYAFRRVTPRLPAAMAIYYVVSRYVGYCSIAAPRDADAPLMLLPDAGVRRCAYAVITPIHVDCRHALILRHVDIAAAAARARAADAAAHADLQSLRVTPYVNIF